MANAKESKVDLTKDRVFPLGWGLVYRAVCAPASWTPEQVAADVTKNDPPGTSVKGDQRASRARGHVQRHELSRLPRRSAPEALASELLTLTPGVHSPKQ